MRARRSFPPLLGAVAAIVLAASAIAEEFVVSSASQIDTALDSAGPGDVIVMTDGIWTNQFIRFRGDGTATQPLTLRAQTPGGVILNGTSRLEIGGRHLVVEGLRFEGGALSSGHVVQFRSGSTEAEDSVLRDSTIVGYNPSDRETRYFWVSMYGKRNIVERCLFENHDHSGVTVVIWGDWPNDHIIRDNHFKDRPEGTANGWETIRIGTSEVTDLSSRTTIESNLFERTDGEIEVISDKTANNVHRFNTFREMAATLTLRHATNAVVEGNYFLANGVNRSGGVRVIGPGHRIWNNYFEGISGRTEGTIALEAGEPNAPNFGYEQVTDAIIAHNTFVDSDEPAFALARSLGSSGRTLAPSGVTIYGNLVSLPGETVATHTNPGVMWDDNIAFASGLGSAPSSGVTLVMPDPLSATAQEIQRPAVGGPADNAATTALAFVTDDADGEPRGATRDAGSDEITASPPDAVRGPLTAEMVGPLWAREDPPDPPDGPDASRAVFIEAEETAAILDPDGDDVVFFVRNDSSASNGAVLKSPDGTRSNQGTQESVAVYDVTFPQPGDYRVYYKARGFSGSTDSFFRAGSLNADPSLIESTTSNGTFRWEEGGEIFSVTLAGIVDELRIGRREQDTEIDAIILFPGDALTGAELDALLAIGPVEPCDPDITFDGVVDVFDAMAYLALYDAGDLAADESGNGQLEPSDIIRFILKLEAGCD
ncbi:MAG: polysaccharide lyase 6 family protein [Planctomycetota bacterium]